MLSTVYKCIYRYINICSSHGFIMGIFQPCPKKNASGFTLVPLFLVEAMLPGHIEAVAGLAVDLLRR